MVKGLTEKNRILTEPPPKVEMEIKSEFPFKFGAFALILRMAENHKMEILLVWRDDFEIWNLPGGGIEQGENRFQAVVREVEEEIGLKVEPIATSALGYSEALDKADPIGSENREDLEFVVFCKVVGGTLNQSVESQKLDWFPIDNLPAGLFFKHKVAIEAALKVDHNLAVESTQMHEVDTSTIELN